MSSLLVTILPVLLALAPPIDPGRFEASVAIGAGYDGNLALAPSGSTQSSIGTATLSVWADGGWSAPLGDRSRLYAGLRYDGALCPDVPDFSRQVPGADLALTHVFNAWFAALVSATGGYAFYGDGARSGPRLSGRFVLRAHPLEPLTLRMGYARSQNWAVDPVFSLGTDRLFATAEVQVIRRTYLAGGYTYSAGDQVFYRSETSLPPGRATGHLGTGSFATLVPYQANATEHTFTLRAEQWFGASWYLLASYDHTRGTGDQGRYLVNSFFGAVGYRFSP
jgi:hypothetical protein